MQHPTFHGRLLLVGDTATVKTETGPLSGTITDVRFVQDPCASLISVRLEGIGEFTYELDQILDHASSHDNQVNTIVSYAMCYPMNAAEAMKMRDWLVYRDSTDEDDSEIDEDFVEITHENPSLRGVIHQGNMEDCTYSSCFFPRQPKETHQSRHANALHPGDIEDCQRASCAVYPRQPGEEPNDGL